jgi:hypothetical protein
VIRHTCTTPGDLQEVIDGATPGDTIEIAAGICTGKAIPSTDFWIKKSLALRGAGPGNTVLQGSGAPNRRVVAVSAGVVATLEGLTITGGTIDEMGAGGGFINDGTATLIEVMVSGNEAGGGGGLMNNPGASLTLIDSTVTGNTATGQQDGGAGIRNGIGATLSLINSTVSGNRSVEQPGDGAQGGGITTEAGGKVTLINSTVTANVAERGRGGGIYNGAGAVVVLSNSIVAGNTAPGDAMSGMTRPPAPDCFGEITSEGNNLVGSTSGCSFTPAPSDLVNVDPKLGPLADNGGATSTHGLLVGSPALDHTPAPCRSDLDQRGVFRPQGAGCDIGSVERASPSNVSVGLVDPATGEWHLRSTAGPAADFFFGNPGDYPMMGDWDCDGIDTPGLYRQSDGFVYLRNSNTQGIADIRFFFGNPGDIPLAGDFNGDGCDTVSISRPSQGRVFIINRLGANEGGLGAAEFDYYFGNPGDKPFVTDFNGNRQDTVGLHRESTGLVYFRMTHTQGVADAEFIFGDPGDRLVAGDWNSNGIGSPALFRPSSTTFYFRLTNAPGVADAEFMWGKPDWLPVAGVFGLGWRP